MTAVAAWPLALAAVAAAVNWVAVALRWQRVEYVAKPLTMAALASAAALLDAVDPSRQAWFVAAALFSIAGDVFLMLPRDRFVAGLASFLMAHLCYVAGFIKSPLSGSRALAGAALVAVVMAVVGRPLVQHVREGHPRLLAPVAAYMLVIGAMVVTAFAAGPLLAVAGALLFFTSDALIGWRRFVHEPPWAPVTIMVTYHLGQAGLLLSLARG